MRAVGAQHQQQQQHNVMASQLLLLMLLLLLLCLEVEPGGGSVEVAGVQALAKPWWLWQGSRPWPNPGSIAAQQQFG